MGRSAIVQRGGALVAAATIATAVGLAFGRIFTGRTPTYELIAIGVASGTIAWATERRGMSSATAASALGLVLACTWLVAVRTTWFGLPTAETLRAIGDLASQVGAQARFYTSPAPATASLMLAGAIAMWAAVFSCYALAFRAQSPLLGLVPPLALIVFADVVLHAAVRPQYGIAFLLAALAVLFADSTRRIRAWGPVWSRVRQRRRPELTVGPNARRVALTAVLIAAVAPLVVPGFGTKPPVNLTSLGAGDEGVHLGTLVSIGSVLNNPDAGEALFELRTRNPSYVRMLTLDAFDGSSWGPATGDPVRVGPRTLPVEPIRDGSSSTATITIATDGLLDNYLFAPANTTSITIDRPVDFDPASSALLLDAPPEKGLSYTVTSTGADPSPEALRTDPVQDRPDERWINEDALPPEIATTAAAWTKSARTPYEKVLAIIDHLHTFAYDRSVSYGAGSDAWTTFLHDERGFCQQFAGLMAIMLRELGIPARVAVGFTPGRLSGPDTYTVTGANLHAWVEVPFAHYGWLTFDPTPTIPEDPSVSYQVSLRELTKDCPKKNDACGGGGSGPTPIGNQGGQATGPDAGGTIAIPPASHMNETLAVVIAAAAVLLGFALCIPLFRRVRRSRRLRRARDPRTLILATYDVFGERAAELGWSRAVGETPDEFRQRLDRTAPFDGATGARLGRFTTTVVEAAYSSRTPPAEAAADAGADADALLEVLRDTTPLRHRLRGRYLTPRPDRASRDAGLTRRRRRDLA